MPDTAAHHAPWTAADVPDQSGRIAVVTGSNTGIGLDAARVLAGHGATVVLACRDAAKMHAAAAKIATPVETVRLDLASLASIRAAAGELHERFERIDLLINNAGVMDTPHATTADGFELQFGVNHLGHFALSGLLLDLLLKAPGSRVVTVSSINHRQGSINFGDLQSEHEYKRTAAYGQSKLANLMFTYELQRRLAAAGSPTQALAAHPGFARTELTRYLPPLARLLYTPVVRFYAQPSAIGALATLRAATDPAASGGQYYGPDRRREERGHPVVVASSERSHDVDAQQRLWRESERLTGVVYPAL